MIWSVVAVQNPCYHGRGRSVEFDDYCTAPVPCSLVFCCHANSCIVKEGDRSGCLVFKSVSGIVLPGEVEAAGMVEVRSLAS